MDKREFLDILRQTLAGEVKPDVIEQNITFYDQYLNAASQEEQNRLLSELGDPRLIAKTIIEKEKAAKSKGIYTESQGSYTNSTEEDYNDRDNHSERGKNIYFTNFKWYHKLLIGMILLLLLIILVFLGRIIIGFLLVFALPIILILLLLTLFRRR